MDLLVWARLSDLEICCATLGGVDRADSFALHAMGMRVPRRLCALQAGGFFGWREWGMGNGPEAGGWLLGHVPCRTLREPLLEGGGRGIDEGRGRC